MSKTFGLQFHKLDLHVHTPASHDFTEKSVSPKMIVERCISRGLRGIAVTDHNAGEWVDKIKEEAKGKRLAVFPGVEIYCTGGKSGIHVIGILDTDKGTKHIEGILAALLFNPDKYGTKEAVTTKSPYDVIDVITSEPYNGIAILAHCTSTKGVLHDITGETRTKIFEHEGLLAVESTDHDFLDEEKIKKGTRAIDLLNGKNENYSYRKLGVYIASDSRNSTDAEHSFNGIGSKYTYFKIDEDCNLESLRQCFIDRDVRIRQHFEYKESVYPFLKTVKVSGGFFDGQAASFHPGLNSILGGKGAGKSLLVELLRFVTGQPPAQKEILEDHNRKLDKKLETYGSVELEILDETGMVHKISRLYNPSEGNPYPEEDYESIASAFPILFLSQNEIVKIAEDERQQIAFIDRFFDFKHFQNKIKNIERDLAVLDTKFADGVRSIHILTDIRKQIQRNQAEVEKMNKLLSDPIYDTFKLLEQKDKTLQGQQSIIKELKLNISLSSQKFSEMEGANTDNLTSADPSIRRNEDTIKDTKKKISELYSQAMDILDAADRSVLNEIKKWNTAYLPEKTKYEDHIRNSGGDKKEIEASRLKLNKELDDLEKRAINLQAQSQNLKTVKEDRDTTIEKLFKVYEEYSKERSKKCQKFENESGGRLKVKIHESTNVEEFRNKLVAMKKGSYLRDSEIDAICSNITPNEFILHLLRFDVNKDVQKLKPIVDKTGVEPDKLLTLTTFLLSQINYEELLQLQYLAHPQDRPEIRYAVNKDRYELIRDISVGQKCTAMLIMALSDGKFPIVIDQPEDSLDVRSIWDDMCSKIRKCKESRQFVFTTHNSSLAVASDTDKFTIVESDAIHGRIVMSGALDAKPIKEEVIKYLEGGKQTFRTKTSKYGMSLKRSK